MPDHTPEVEKSGAIYTRTPGESPKHDGNLEKFVALARGDTQRDTGGEGDIPPTPPPPPASAPATPNEAAADRLVQAESQARALTLPSFREAMRARAASPLVLARLDALLEGTADPVTGRIAQLKPETWDAIRQDVTNRGYGRPHQSLDVTSNGETLTPGVVFLPAPVPLPPPGADNAIELDEGADLAPRLASGAPDVRGQATHAVARMIEAGRDSGELPR